MGKKLQKIYFTKFSNQKSNMFILLLQKGVYCYEYRIIGEDSIKFWIPEKEDFYSHLNMEDITNADYAQAKRVVKVLK